VDYSPAIVMEDDSYTYDVTSPWWNGICSQLPCSMNLAWPGYATQSLAVTLMGQPAVIQTWKGWCQSPPDIPGVVAFPGGVGAEVGIYRIDPGRQIPDQPPGVPSGLPSVVVQFLEQRLADAAGAALGPDSIWWPAPDLVDPAQGVSLRLFEPKFGDELLAYSTTAYWTCKWMHAVPSFALWSANWHKEHWSWTNWQSLDDSDDFTLDFTVNGQRYQWTGSTGPIVAVS
jgi:hypothetical protein